MKILIDARFYGLENGGIGRYTMNLVDQLATKDKKNEYVILLRKKYFNRLNLPDNWTKVLTDFRHYSLIEQIKLSRIISSYNPDVSHFPHFNVPLLYKGKFVVTIHDMIMHKSKGREATTLPLFLYMFKRLAYKYVFANAVKRALRIIVPSKAVKKELVDYYSLEEQKVIVTYEGFDEKIKETGKRGVVLKKYGLDSPYFIYVGNAYPHKNIARAIEAIVHLNAVSKRKILFAIASSRDVFAERLRKMTKSLKAEKYIKFLGFVSDKELGVLYKNAVAFVYPSLIEGFGLQGLESIAVGTLVLASNIPVFKEVYKDNILYFNPYDFSSIEKVMENAINMSKEERERLIEKSQKFIKKYSWAKMARQTLKIYEDSASIRQSK